MTLRANTRRGVFAGVFLLFISSAPLASAGNVLIIGDDSTGSGDIAQEHVQDATANLKGLLLTAGHQVTVVPAVPADLTQYGQVWDLIYNTGAFASGVQSLYLSYLASGRSLFLVGENDSRALRNTSLLDFITAAGGSIGNLVFQDPPTGGGGGNLSIQIVQPPFNNSIANDDVAYAAPGGVRSAGNGQFISLHPTTIGSALAFGPGQLTNAAAGRLVIVFDVNFMENDGWDPDGDDRKLLQNITAYLDTPSDVGASVVASGLNFPFGVAVGANGAVYIADHNNHRVLRIGQSDPVAGAALAEVRDDRYNGDGIDAKLALLDGPSGVAVDAEGNVFIADSGNHIVRKVSTGGMITTVAGTPTDNSLGLEGAALEVGNGGPATSAVLNGPRAVAVDSAGNLYIVDTIHQQVRKVDSSGNITVVAGVAGETGSNDGAGSCPIPAGTCIAARLNDPRGVAVDSFGDVFIADAGNDKIRKVSGNVVTTLAAGVLDAPTGVAIASDGTLYIADHNNNRIQRVSGTDVTTVPVTGLSGPYGVALDPTTGDLYIADKQNHRVLKVDFTPPPILLTDVR